MRYFSDAKALAIEEALFATSKLQDMDRFCKAASIFISSPACSSQGTTNSDWYTLEGGCEDYAVCSACYACCVEIWGLEKFYQKASTTDSSTARLCNFNKDSPRFSQSMEKLSQAMYTGVWSVFADFIHKYIRIPECPRSEHVENRRWYGFDDCLICEDCYISFCMEGKSGTNLKLQLENELINEGRMCCLYSPRMRAKWAEACENGDPQSLIEFSRTRHGVYARTVPQIKAMREMQQLLMMQGLSAGFTSMLYQGAQGIQTVSDTTDGHLHGNSSLGWHETENGATSEQFRQQMNADFNQANASGSWMLIFRLAAEWDQVE